MQGVLAYSRVQLDTFSLGLLQFCLATPFLFALHEGCHHLSAHELEVVGVSLHHRLIQLLQSQLGLVILLVVHLQAGSHLVDHHSGLDVSILLRVGYLCDFLLGFGFFALLEEDLYFFGLEEESISFPCFLEGLVVLPQVHVRVDDVFLFDVVDGVEVAGVAGLGA